MYRSSKERRKMVGIQKGEWRSWVDGKVVNGNGSLGIIWVDKAEFFFCKDRQGSLKRTESCDVRSHWSNGVAVMEVAAVCGGDKACLASVEVWIVVELFRGKVVGNMTNSLS
jgi:hypothetical protein